VRFEIVQDIAAAPDAVDGALVDPAFLVRMAELPKLGSAEVVSQLRDGDTMHQDVRYLFQAELSSAVTRVVDPKKLTWIERSVCDLAAHRFLMSELRRARPGDAVLSEEGADEWPRRQRSPRGLHWDLL